MSLVAWSYVCMPRQEGGLAIKQLTTWNKAALGAQLWKVVSRKKCLWNSWVQAVYLKGESVWNVEIKYNDPWSWRKMVKLKEILSRYVKVMVGDGRTTSLFYDNWLHIGSLSSHTNLRVNVWGSSTLVGD